MVLLWVCAGAGAAVRSCGLWPGTRLVLVNRISVCSLAVIRKPLATAARAWMQQFVLVLWIYHSPPPLVRTWLQAKHSATELQQSKGVTFQCVSR